MRFPRGRLRSRIIWTTALVSALAMGVMIGTAILALAAVTRSNVDSALRDRFALDAASIRYDPRGPTVALRTPVDSVEDTTWLFDPSGGQLLGPEAGRRIQKVAQQLSTVTVQTRLTRHDRVFLAGPVTVGDREPVRGVLVVSQDLDPYEDTRDEVLVGLAALGLLVVAGSTAVAAWTMARTLAPVDAMASLAEDWSQSDLDARFDAVGSEHQIAHLGRTLNVLLDRVAGALRGEQRLTSELAHELRTPLTGMRGEVELALMTETDAGTRQRLERVILLVDQMGGTITTLLAIARGDKRQESTPVGTVLAAALAGRTAGGPAIRQPDPAPTLRLGVTTDIAVRALSPLIDNALRYAHTQVTLTVSDSERTVDITVSDDGPGVDATVSDPEALFAAGSRTAASPGAGLGLSLARRVAHTLGGNVAVTSVRDPTSFTLTLPKP